MEFGSNLKSNDRVLENLSPPVLYEEAVKNREAILTNNYALRVLTGRYTGRSPRDKFIVDQPAIHDDIDWGDINQPIPQDIFERLFKKVQNYLSDKKLYVKDCYAGADKKYQLSIHIVSEAAYHGLFAHNMFIRPSANELANHGPEYTVIAAPTFKANPLEDGTRSEAFIFLNFERKIILIGGTRYSGEIKKGIFSIMNYLLPKQGVMSMHCSVNMSEGGKTTIFFGLSGTGKTTLSSDPDRLLIGDDEHGWSEDGIFNIEGGCYAKTINLTEEEPLIYAATKEKGVILENVVLNKYRQPQYDDDKITQNTRCAYPIECLPNVSKSGMGGHPDHIFFLTCDAYGVFPPLSKLTVEQAMYHFISGYTAKVAGTERGVSEPKATFSACYGAPFMPLHPAVYAELLVDKICKHNTSVWLLNTGWTGGAYGDGSRIALSYTRQMLSEVLKSKLQDMEFQPDPVFGVSIPKSINGIPNELLIPKDTWSDSHAYDRMAEHLIEEFQNNFQQFRNKVSAQVVEAGPS